MNAFKTIISFLLSLLLILTTSICKGQNKEHCKMIYKAVDEAPCYLSGTVGLHRYFTKELMPIIGECYKQDDFMVTKMTMILTIGAEGHVIEVTFPDKQIPTRFQAQLREPLLKMSGWLPGKIKGKPVCSYYLWTIGCILWESE